MVCGGFISFYSNKLLHFVGAVAVDQVIDEFGAIYYFCHHFIYMCNGGPLNFLVAEVYCIYELLVAGGFYVAPMREIAFRRCR